MCVYVYIYICIHIFIYIHKYDYVCYRFRMVSGPATFGLRYDTWYTFPAVDPEKNGGWWKMM